MSCFVIAECGINWRDLVDADQMIKAAAEAGADACKFQAYDTKFSPYLREGTTFHKRAKELNAIRLDESTVRYLYWRCQQHGIEFMCTPFYVKAVDLLNPYVERWKIRFNDRCDADLLNKCLDTKKEILLSTDIPIVPNNGKVKYLYCCPEYPPKNSPKCSEFKNFDGYSCHIPLDADQISAVEFADLEYLEVHVRLDHYESPHYCPIDTAVSITMSELAELCRRLK